MGQRALPDYRGERPQVISEGKFEQSEDLAREGVGPMAVEIAVNVWVIGAMGYFYHIKGYFDLIVKIWRFHLG